MLFVKYPTVVAYCPAGAKYETMYVEFALRFTGRESWACCHPDADSPVKVTDANSEPDRPHK